VSNAIFFQKVDFKQEPIYIVPSPRLVKPHFPKVANVVRLNYPNPNVASPGMLNVYVEKNEQVEAESKMSKGLIKPINVTADQTRNEKIVEITTKRSSRYRENSKKSDFS